MNADAVSQTLEAFEARLAEQDQRLIEMGKRIETLGGKVDGLQKFIEQQAVAAAGSGSTVPGGGD